MNVCCAEEFTTWTAYDGYSHEQTYYYQYPILLTP